MESALEIIEISSNENEDIRLKIPEESTVHHCGERRGKDGGCNDLMMPEASLDVSDDEDCVILDGAPKSVAADSEFVELGGEMLDEMLIVGEKGQFACRDYPHPRYACATFLFTMTPHEKHCDMCHCYVCDCPAPCTYWASHCSSTHKEHSWRIERLLFRKRKREQQNVLRLIRQQDEQMDRLEKKMEEMMAAITRLQSQPQSPKVLPPKVRQPEAVQIADSKKEFTFVNRDDRLKKDSVQASENDIKQIVEQQVREAMSQSKGGASILKGRPYPEEFDAVQYPKGFVLPSFKTFDGTGNPRQHVAHFRASCCNAGGSDALLCRQFVISLLGVAFDWYAELPNNSVKTFAELENLFVKRFAGPQHHITVVDLVAERQKPTETLVEYILRWRNLSMKCVPQLQEQDAIKILLKSIHGPVAFLLKGFTIKTFEKLLKKAGSLQNEAIQFDFFEEAEKLKPVKAFEKKSEIVAAVGRGRQPMQIQAE
ncbi:uncharacterized protein LOC110021822 [Phalaenopsis equestris]|uniref:uncharacterized protein LOC110021822 n=1 Tax=Phalaenopsis equestris TaxID=78828 RepID=UPI0009E5D8E5|nr:uncharacterized protein LOC110021822 [Phalaenopsis equestris]